jgi:hypothetical protein
MIPQAWRVLRLAREPLDGRTGVFTSGLVSRAQGRQIALYFVGPKHAGETSANTEIALVRRSHHPTQSVYFTT